VSFPGMDKAPYLICITCFEGPLSISETGRCTCEDRIAYLRQCKHERAVLQGRFDKQLWQKRWLQRSSIVMSNGTSAIANDGAVVTITTNSIHGGSNRVIGAASVIEVVGVIGQPKESEEDIGMFPDVEDDTSFSMLDGTCEVIEQTFVGATISHQQVVEKHPAATNLGYWKKMDIIGDLAKLYEGHPDEMEWYGAMIAQSSFLKGKYNSSIGSSEYLLNYLRGYTSCQSKDVLFSQTEFSQTESNEAAPTTVPLAPALVPFGCLATSATGAPQRKRLKSHRERASLINSKKLKQGCGFCWLPGHTVKQCDLLRSFAGSANEILVHDKKEFAWSLVSPNRVFQVECNTDEMIWQLGGLPLDTHYVSVLAMLHEFNQRTDDNVGGAGLLVKLWSRNAQNCNGHTGPTVYRSQAVSEWILSKGQAKPKRLFSCLQSFKPVNQVETTTRAEI
jgi:hypothetical protein